MKMRVRTTKHEDGEWVAWIPALELTAPDVVGLMRCNDKGKRHLHVWADGGYGDELGRERETDPMPCECAL